MKKGILLLGIFSGILGTAFSQTTIEIIPQGGYTFADRVNFSNSFGYLEPAWNYGGSLQFNVNRHIGIQFLYNRIETQAKMYPYGALPGDQPFYNTQAALNYILAGPVLSFPLPNSPANLFLSPSFGAVIYSPSPYDFTSNAKFAFDFEAGTNIYLNPNVGIRLSGRLLATAPSSSGYYFGGWGDPDGYYFNNGTIVQFGFNLGIIIGLGRELPAMTHADPRPPRHAPKRRKYYYY